MDQGGETDAISLQDSSVGQVTWASGLFRHRSFRILASARGTSDHSLSESLHELLAPHRRAQKGFSRGGKFPNRLGENEYRRHYPGADGGER